MCLVRVADNHVDFRHCCEFLGCSLRVTSGDHDARRRICPVHTPNDLAHFVVGRCGNGAGVQNDERSVAGVSCLFEPAVGQKRLDTGAVSLGRAASEILNEKFPGRAHLSILSGVI